MQPFNYWKFILKMLENSYSAEKKKGKRSMQGLETNTNRMRKKKQRVKFEKRMQNSLLKVRQKFFIVLVKKINCPSIRLSSDAASAQTATKFG